LICGGAGCGKTLLAMEFLVRGITQFDEHGVFMAFEETAQELTENVRSLGFDLQDLVAQKKLLVDFVRVERQEVEETGEYDLEGLFVRLAYAIDTVGAKRVVLDTIESLFSGFSNTAVLRAELRRLFRWLKDKGVTAIITGEKGDGSLTRQGLEEYVSDCVILLDHRVTSQISTRRLRIVKYRGTTHGTNEYPFLIDEDGITVLPITSLGLQHQASNERISSGLPRLDRMLGGQGYYRGSTILISGTAGTGKTSLAAHFVGAACKRGERCLYFAFEESPSQILRNMRSIGVDLEPHVKEGVLRFNSVRSIFYGLEMHLAMFHKLIETFQPHVVVFDPIGSLISAGTPEDANATITRLIDFLKLQRVTSMTNQLREFLLTDHGIELVDVYLGPEGVLAGSMRQAQEAREKAAALVRQQQSDARLRERGRKREALEARILAMRKELEAEEEEAEHLAQQEAVKEAVLAEDRERMARSRRADAGDKGAASRRNRETANERSNQKRGRPRTGRS
jgi:circadian clock protein KaiC